MAMSLPDRGRVLNWAGLLLLIALVAPFVVYAVPGVVGAEGGYVVLSGSMEPSISVGDVVIVDDVAPTEVEEGDVITYLRSDAETPTTHRVIDVTEQNGERAFITQGDANDDPDAAPVPGSRVFGEVVVVIPYMGYVIEFVNTPTGFLVLVVVPFVLLALSEVRSVLSDDGSVADDGTESTGATGGPGSDGTDPDRRLREPEPDPDTGPAEVPPMEPFEAVAVDGDSSGSRAIDDAGANGGPGTFVEATADAETTAVTEATTDAETTADAETSEGAETGEGAIAITRTDLRLSGIVLTGTAAYAGWVVYHVQTAWSFGVAFGSGFGLLLVGGMYYAAGETGSGSDSPATGDAPGRVEDRTGDGDDRSREAIGSSGVVRADGEGGSSSSNDDLGIERTRDPSPNGETPNDGSREDDHE